jgi:2-polyprenyl-3-methyl-5-hydroxy-6-metoxy-1,4-benzoquinol methylase
VLDAGCGSGLLLGLLATTDRLRAGLGFDANASAIALAQDMAKHSPNGARLSFQHLDATSSWPAGTFDAVCLIDVLHHVPEPDQRQLIITAASRLEPGGVLVYKDIAPRPRWRAAANQLHDLLLSRQWVRLRSAEEICGWAKDASLSLVSRRQLDTLWYRHDLLVFCRGVN